MIKILPFDLETTGLDHKIHGVLQISGMIEIDGVVKEEFNFKCKPFKGQIITRGAMETIGLGADLDQAKVIISGYDEPKDTHRKLVTLWGKYVDKFNKLDKYFPCGYNIATFDMPFLRAWFENCGDKYFGSWFNGIIIDPITTVNNLIVVGALELENRRLGTVHSHFFPDINLRAHDAMEDIRATMRLKRHFDQFYTGPRE